MSRKGQLLHREWSLNPQVFARLNKMRGILTSLNAISDLLQSDTGSKRKGVNASVCIPSDKDIKLSTEKGKSRTVHVASHSSSMAKSDLVPKSDGICHASTSTASSRQNVTQITGKFSCVRRKR